MVRNNATNKVSLLKMATDDELLSLKCKKITIVLKDFAKWFTNEYLSLLHERYALHKVVDFM